MIHGWSRWRRLKHVKLVACPYRKVESLFSLTSPLVLPYCCDCVLLEYRLLDTPACKAQEFDSITYFGGELEGAVLCS